MSGWYGVCQSIQLEQRDNWEIEKEREKKKKKSKKKKEKQNKE